MSEATQTKKELLPIQKFLTKAFSTRGNPAEAFKWADRVKDIQDVDVVKAYLKAGYKLKDLPMIFAGFTLGYWWAHEEAEGGPEDE